MPRAWRVLEVRGAHVIHILGIERDQHIRRIERQTTGIVGALEIFFRGIERHRLVEIEIAHVIDRQLVVEAQAIGEIEFHVRLGSLRGKGINSETARSLHPLFSNTAIPTPYGPLWQSFVGASLLAIISKSTTSPPDAPKICLRYSPPKWTHSTKDRPPCKPPTPKSPNACTTAASP
ncbi:hypothetical protein D3C73_738920 [compost metagenome]